MQKIEILGPGCVRCKQTHRVIQHVVDQEGLQVEVVKEESLARMVALNVMSTPAVAIDGKVVLTGRIPTAEEVRQLLAVSATA
jgi:small redox-active disulfide protein 2